ncbi:hypothetical protein ANCDUO_26175, partial [Ancylostoma duodenale]
AKQLTAMQPVSGILLPFQDIEQCKEACRQFDCAAVNLFQLGEFSFKCEILSTVYGMTPATGAACYYATDSMLGGGYGYPYGRRK